MLQQLSIRNYTIIRELSADFGEGFSVITGETGAGKSVLLEALSFVLGERADSSVLKDKSKKCVVEALFFIKEYGLAPFFTENDLDYDDTCLIRREISPQGKSRTFINDTPVSLRTLQQLTAHLADIHYQHGNLLLQDKHFQLQLVDQAAHLQASHQEYMETYRQYLQLQKKQKELQEQHALQDADYLRFLHEELQAAHLEAGEQQHLEQELQMLSHAAEIKQQLFAAYQTISGEETDLLSLLKEVGNHVQHAGRYQNELSELNQRVDSVIIELEDIAVELNRAQEKVEYTPDRISAMQERLDTLYNLQRKHHVQDEAGLLHKADEIAQTLQKADEAREMESQIQKELKEVEKILRQKAEQLHKQRAEALPAICQKLIWQLQHMQMPHARISIDLKEVPFNEGGCDDAEILFSANAGMALQPLSKIASGGEMSRVMLAVKTLISEKNVLPTIIFDEIDSGVSGEVTMRMAEVMRSLSRYSQVIAISHQAQIASRADKHYLVYKETVDGETFSHIKLLNREENLLEIAKMISDGKASDASIRMAERLING